MYTSPALIRAPSNRSTRGFTLLEALVVIAIVGILASAAIPQFQTFINRRLIAGEVASLSSSFRLARAEAIRRGRPVTVCPSNNPNDAAPTCSNGAGPLGWATGWIVFEDDTPGGRGTVEAGETIISVQSGFQNSGGIVGTAGYFLTFQGNGMPVRGAPFPNTTFTIFPPTSDKVTSKLTRQVIIDVVGRARISSPNP